MEKCIDLVSTSQLCLRPLHHLLIAFSKNSVYEVIDVYLTILSVTSSKTKQLGFQYYDLRINWKSKKSCTQVQFHSFYRDGLHVNWQ